MRAKKWGKLFAKKLGFEITRVLAERPGTAGRPVGRMDVLIEDLKARGLNCTTILDVGAHKCDWSRLVKRVFPHATVCMVEPQAEMRHYLDQFCRDFPGSAYFLGGAGACADKKIFTVWPDLAGSSFLPPPDPEKQSLGIQRTIEIQTIDAILAEKHLPAPELIKLDIQGYELEALKGATGTFGNTEAFILEVSLYPFSDVPGIPLFAEVVNFMLEKKYVVYDFPGFLRRPLDGALGQCDVCFVKEGSFLRKSSEWS